MFGPGGAGGDGAAITPPPMNPPFSVPAGAGVTGANGGTSGPFCGSGGPGGTGGTGGNALAGTAAADSVETVPAPVLARPAVSAGPEVTLG
jgi:hypothetical protein